MGCRLGQRVELPNGWFGTAAGVADADLKSWIGALPFLLDDDDGSSCSFGTTFRSGNRNLEGRCVDSCSRCGGVCGCRLEAAVSHSGPSMILTADELWLLEEACMPCPVRMKGKRNPKEKVKECPPSNNIGAVERRTEKKTSSDQ